MAKYKLLTQKGYPSNRFKLGEIYDESYGSYFKVSFLVKNFPSDWKLVKEKSKEELLLEEAKVRYPIGTKYIPTFRENKIDFERIQYSPFLIESKEIIQDGPGGHSIWSKSKGWAKIIKEEPMCTEKKIIGYKTPCALFGGEIRPGQEYKPLASKNNRSYAAISDNGIVCSEKYNLPKEIVETWTPIYKHTHPNITINGYKGEFFDGYVKFGCAEIHKQLFMDLYAVKGSTLTNGRQIESVTIGKGTFTKDQIKEIAEYYLSK